jgi:hypothetical protein
MTLSDCSSSVEVLCELGCLDAPTPHCAVMVPANVETAYPRVALSAASVVVNDLHVIDTTTCGWAPTTGARFSGTNVTMDGGGEACLFVLGSLDVTAAGVLGAFGTRPLIIVSRGNVNIAGLVSVDSARSLADGSGPIVGAGSGTGGSAGGNGDGHGHRTIERRWRRRVRRGRGERRLGSRRQHRGVRAVGPAPRRSFLSEVGPLAAPVRAPPPARAARAGEPSRSPRSPASASAATWARAAPGGAGGDGVFLSAAAGGGGGSGGGILLEAMDLILTGGLVNIAGGGGGGSGCSGVGSVAGGDGADGSDVPSARAAGGTSCMGGQSGGAGSGGTAAAGAGRRLGLRVPGEAAQARDRWCSAPRSASSCRVPPRSTPRWVRASGRYVVSDISRR